MVLAAAPSAINIMVLATFTGNHEQITANLLFYSYTLAIFTLTGNSVFFMYLLS